MNTPNGPRRGRTRRRWSLATASSSTRPIGCSRCGTWAATRRTSAMPCRGTGSPGTSPISASCPAPTSLSTSPATRQPSGSIRSSAIRRPASRWGSGTTSRSRCTDRATAFTGRLTARPAGRETAPRFSTTRSARSGSSASATRSASGCATAAIGKPPTSSAAQNGRRDSRCRGCPPIASIRGGPSTTCRRSSTTWTRSATKA